jgi:hypothetical protein
LVFFYFKKLAWGVGSMPIVARNLNGLVGFTFHPAIQSRESGGVALFLISNYFHKHGRHARVNGGLDAYIRDYKAKKAYKVA